MRIDCMTNYQSEVMLQVIQPARLSLGLLIHPDILSKVNCARTSQTALSNPGARSAMIGWSCVKQAQMCSALNISQLRRAREDKKEKARGWKEKKNKLQGEIESENEEDRRNESEKRSQKEKDGVKWPTLRHKHIRAKYNCGSLWLSVKHVSPA